jgi:large subunit ribosomal protein L35
MAPGKHAVRPLNSCLRCVRQTGNGNASLIVNSARFLSSTARTPEDVQVNKIAKVEKVDKFPELDPSTVVGKRDERRLIRFRGVMPIGSRRRRAALQNSQNIPFELLPYQCFQEARKVLQEDRQEKIKQIEVQRLRIANLQAQDEAVSGGKLAKENRIRSMYNRLEELKILADINDPVVKKKFEDGEGMLFGAYNWQS